MKKSNQGVFHLMSILFIPGILVSAFLIQNYWLTGVLAGCLLFCIWYIFVK